MEARQKTLLAVACGLLTTALVAGCGAPTGNTSGATLASGADTSTDTSSNKPMSNRQFAVESLMADDWYQTSGEAKALYEQGYNIGKLQLTLDLQKKMTKKPAVILDLDETVLDNSPYEAMAIKNGQPIHTHGTNG